MGVQGLDTFLDTHQKIYRDVKFRMSRLVVDGSNLIYLLYFSSGLDQNHGGEYAAFEAVIERFIATLRTCEVTPYVVMDGGSDLTEKKLETVAKTAEDQIKKAHQAAVSGRKENILPLLARLVFKQTLARLEVPMAQRYGEADREIAALASEWNYPVLSTDSDFYIFNLPAGLLPFRYFQWEEVKQNGSQNFIPCKRYYTSSFCIFFGIQSQLLPTFAVFAGYDYIKQLKINWTQFAPADSETPSCLEGLLCWLKGFQQPQEALEAALELMGELSKKSKAELLQNLSEGIKEYQLPSSSLKGFFLHGTAPLLPAVGELVGPAQQVPDWIRLQVMQARLTTNVLDVLRLHRLSQSITVGHKNQPSVNQASRPLRKVMYGLLLGRGRSVKVEERDREGLKLKFIPVQPTCSVVAQRLHLSSLHKAKMSERLQVLLEALGVTEASMSSLPPQLRLPVAVTCYWLQKAQPPPNMKLLKALLLGISNEDALRSRADLQAEHSHSKLNMYAAHAFNQWQACLKDSIHLNQLLGFPLSEPDVARLYQGTLVHQLVHRLRTGGRLKTFLRSNRSSANLYHAMLRIICQFHASRAKRRAAAQQHTLTDITANLQWLYDEEEVVSVVQIQKELELVDQVSVRTRYKTKERINRCNRPELARKEERRGQDLL